MKLTDAKAQQRAYSLAARAVKLITVSQWAFHELKKTEGTFSERDVDLVHKYLKVIEAELKAKGADAQTEDGG